MAQKFGGITFHSNAPAEGRWEGAAGTEWDTIIVAEIMVESVDYIWWREYRLNLERPFKQKEIVVRATEMHRL